MTGLSRRAQALVDQHAGRSRSFAAAGVTSSVLETTAGSHDPVVCLHGVPTSSYLYRKVIPALALRGMNAVAFDLPGMGLADRPTDFDYTWTGLGAFAAAAVDALGFDRFHLVVHDIGGPVGFELAALTGTRVRSLTVLNTMVAVGTFRKPWAMAPFAIPVVGRGWLSGTPPWVFARLMRYLGVFDQSAVTDPELAAHLMLLRRNDNGAAFLRIMQQFETTAAKEQLYRSVVADRSRPTQVVWGVGDRALPATTHGAQIAGLVGSPMIELPGRHFLQEDNAQAIADAVVALADRS